MVRILALIAYVIAASFGVAAGCVPPPATVTDTAHGHHATMAADHAAPMHAEDGHADHGSASQDAPRDAHGCCDTAAGCDGAGCAGCCGLVVGITPASDAGLHRQLIAAPSAFERRALTGIGRTHEPPPPRA